MNWSGIKTLVTGGTGLIGSATVNQLIDLGAEVYVVSLDQVAVPAGARFIKADLTNKNECLNVFDGMEVVFHLAGIKASARITIERPASFLVPMLQMNTNVIEAVSKIQNPNIVFTSSIGAYAAGETLAEDGHNLTSEPMDTYPGWAKRVAELQLRASNLEFPSFKYTVIRPSNVYGPGDNFDPNTAMVIGSLLGRCLRTKDDYVEVLGQGKALRDFVFSEDVAQALITTASNPKNSLYNVGSGYGVSIRELAQIIQEVTGKSLYFSNSVEPDYPIRILNIKKIQSEYSWRPRVDLRTGIARTWTWLCQNRDESEKRHNYFKEHGGVN